MLKKVGDKVLLQIGKGLVFGALSFSLLLGSFYSLRRKSRNEKHKGEKDVWIWNVYTERKRKDH